MMAKNGPTTITEYIEAAPEIAREHLNRIHAVLRDVAPEGTGVIKWGVPIFWEGRVLFGFAAYKAHLSFGPGENAVEHFSAELADYKTGKGTIQFAYEEPIPEKMVQKIAEYCIKQSKSE
jgi:uncharacterized protein YdhG (YjbR/CyaY superfamily)